MRPSGPCWILTLDASTPRSAIAVGRVDVDAGTHARVASDDEAAEQASAQLMPRVERVLARAGITPRALAAVACGRGPGTFTGTRVAVASAKGLAYGLGVPVVGVSTLAAVAASAEHEGPVLALLDARKGEVYGGRFECARLDGGEGLPRVSAVGDERVAPLATLVEALAPRSPTLRVVGSGVEPYRDALPPSLLATARSLPGPTSAGLWAATVDAWANGRLEDPAALEAVYLRQSYAEIGIHPPKRPFVKSPFV
ncbi:tRNA (adenosine(37)-N6)-threonylcarbamoyltransferase complex dimerization subunit type 1 TsaB [Paraliomyxa miuraensis]|uniref:tRNA (adenosine(37)-N6)-threonylcarbamoyltransferase complex dimerization subunit type 1 TsaB n=1 Tax=Paraliomyxa miuraensis TaxID=376150 RepID=UPI0022535053|nr:tRNA (adenosine(37)-N6)-threonylcarbamoyltransferase complex dimerization subunit type 1 TsaB [Paraliomyxa miuraensis]MCX4240700.1 tRNA (adenosine(37)-N6)-threonylcarbamoyltransferase complex dimerization subunit type 1 TsaB [Paraliomyxa miuraensis]